MKTGICKSSLIILILSVVSFASEYSDKPKYENLPWAVHAALADSGFFDVYELYSAMSTFYRLGDFNGNGALDIAIQIVSKASGKRGIAILHDDDPNYIVIGAGNRFEDLGDDFTWLQNWRNDFFTHQEIKISETAEALVLIKANSDQSLIYYNGESYLNKNLDAKIPTANRAMAGPTPPEYGQDIPQLVLRLSGTFPL